MTFEFNKKYNIRKLVSKWHIMKKNDVYVVALIVKLSKDAVIITNVMRIHKIIDCKS